MALEPELARRSVCHLETTGRRSGVPRRIEIWFAADPGRDRIYLLSGGRDHAHWVRNLRVEPSVRVRIADRWFDGVATDVDGGPDDPVARRALAAKYQGWTEGAALSTWARESLPVAIDLSTASTSGGSSREDRSRG
jgi:deazaflavin-dependent oxidoreductase (nitroreductase family)